MKMSNSNKNANTLLTPKENHCKSINLPNEILKPTNTLSSNKTPNIILNKTKTRMSIASTSNNNNNISYIPINGTENNNKHIVSNNRINNSQHSKNKNKSSTSQLKDLKIRKDAKGVPIIKGKKKHRITFKDALDDVTGLIEEIEIESYKDYNAKELTIIEEKQETIKNKNNNDNTSCACAIF